MNLLGQRRSATFVLVGQLFAEHPLVPAVELATTLVTELATVVTGMQAAAGSQATAFTGFRGGSDERRQAFFSLLGEMRVLNRIAAGLDPAVYPAFRELFRMPRSRSFANIAAHARAFATNATGQEAIFTDRGLPAGFFAAFTAKVTEAEAAVAGRNTGLINRSAATAQIEALGRRGMVILRELDPIVTTVWRNDPAMLAAWRTARRLPRSAPAPAPTAPPDGGSGSTPPAGS